MRVICEFRLEVWWHGSMSLAAVKPAVWLSSQASPKRLETEQLAEDMTWTISASMKGGCTKIHVLYAVISVGYMRNVFFFFSGCCIGSMAYTQKICIFELGMLQFESKRISNSIIFNRIFKNTNDSHRPIINKLWRLTFPLPCIQRATLTW